MAKEKKKKKILSAEVIDLRTIAHGLVLLYWTGNKKDQNRLVGS